MDTKPEDTELAYIDALADLARNNINIVDITYTHDGEVAEPQYVVFEYQWRTPAGTKWTKAVIPWDERGGYAYNMLRLRNMVQSVRSQIERR